MRLSVCFTLHHRNHHDVGDAEIARQPLAVRIAEYTEAFPGFAEVIEPGRLLGFAQTGEASAYQLVERLKEATPPGGGSSGIKLERTQSVATAPVAGHLAEPPAKPGHVLAKQRELAGGVDVAARRL